MYERGWWSHNPIALGILAQKYEELYEAACDAPGGIPVYSGACEITPSVNAQTLGCKGCQMKNDVTVHEIPYFEVSNSSRGMTVTIRSEV